MTTVHLVYSHGNRLGSPDCIGRHLGARLRSRYRVELHDPLAFGAIRPRAGDVLIGHPWPVIGTKFRASVTAPGFRRVIAMTPFCHGDPWQAPYLEPVMPYCDRYLAITGRHWASTLDTSRFAHWAPMFEHLDLAVNRDDYPRVKRSFAPPGKRRWLYIGHTAWYKNTDYLERLVAALPDTEFSWIGSGQGIQGTRRLGLQDFGSDEARALVSDHDFTITVGRADANPTTILESMAWGLIPVCTPQSGYAGYRSIPNVPLDDLDGAIRVLQRLQHCPTSELEALQLENDRLLDDHFNWDRFASQVIAAIESGERHRPRHAPVAQRARLMVDALRAPSSTLRPANVLGCVRRTFPTSTRRIADFVRGRQP